MPDATALARYGLLVVFINVFLDQAGAPVPAVPVLVACGALAASGKISLTLLLLSATSASLTSDLAWFALGRWRGQRVLRIFCRVSLHPDACLAQVTRSMRHHGLISIALAKFLPGLQTVAPPLAGAMGIPVGRFALVSAVSGLIWAGGLVAGGWLFEDTINEVTHRVEAFGVEALVVIGLLLCGYGTFIWWRRRSQARMETGPA